MAAPTEGRLAVELGELVALPGPPGAEGPVAEAIVARLAGLPIAPTRDALGNVRLLAEGSRPRVLVTAHMDQVGYMVSRLGEDGALCLPVGSPQLPPEETTRVRVVGNAHAGFEAELESHGEKGGVLRSERRDEIQIGDRVVFADPLVTREDGRVRGPALDDRIGCLIALRAAQSLAAETDDVAFAWTVREEAEPAGVVRVARDIDPDVVVAVDITYATADGADSMESVLKLGAGPAITLLDGGMVGHSWPLRAFDRAARNLGISWQPEVVRSGLSEAGRVQGMLGIPAIALLVPIENPHSAEEVADLGDVGVVLDLLVAGVRELAGNSPS